MLLLPTGNRWPVESLAVAVRPLLVQAALAASPLVTDQARHRLLELLPRAKPLTDIVVQGRPLLSETVE